DGRVAPRLELDVPAPSPGVERGLLLTLGATLALPAAAAIGLAVGLGAYAVEPGGYDYVVAGLGAAPIAALLTIPAGVFLFGNLSGRGADFGWTLLGSLLGAAAGGALIGIGAAVDEANTLDP